MMNQLVVDLGIVVQLLWVVLVIVLDDELKKNNSDDDEAFKVLKKDSDFIKLNIRWDGEFQFIKTRNGMIGFLINDP